MLTLSDALPNQLHDTLQLLHRPHHPALNELQLGPNRTLQLFHDPLILIDILNRVLRFRMLAQDIVLSSEWMEERGEVLGKSGTGREKVRHSLIESLGVFQELFGCGLESGEPPGVVVELGIVRLCKLGGR